MKLTEKELIVLNEITMSEYHMDRGDEVWDFSVLDYLPFDGKVRSGVFSSLVAKGLIIVREKISRYYITALGEKVERPYYSESDPECMHGAIGITDLGYEELDKINEK